MQSSHHQTTFRCTLATSGYTPSKFEFGLDFVGSDLCWAWVWLGFGFACCGVCLWVGGARPLCKAAPKQTSSKNEQKHANENPRLVKQIRSNPQATTRQIQRKPNQANARKSKQSQARASKRKQTQAKAGKSKQTQSRACKRRQEQPKAGTSK